jgi:hypothetical protein
MANERSAEKTILLIRAMGTVAWNSDHSTGFVSLHPFKAWRSLLSSVSLLFERVALGNAEAGQEEREKEKNFINF